jgi:isopenicillin N synthase-like dioxygenase
MVTENTEIVRDILTKGYSVMSLGARLRDRFKMIFACAETFFLRSSNEEKMATALPELLEGYRAQGTEHSGVASLPDLNESFSVWLKNSAKIVDTPSLIHSDLRRSMTQAMPVLEELSIAILEAVRVQLFPAAEQLVSIADSYLQVNFYNSVDLRREYLQEAHEDGHLFTLTQATTRGLEVSAGDKWTPVLVNDHEAVVMPGSILTAMTGGAVPPLYHRVRRYAESSGRMSIMFFVNPNISVETKAWIINESNANVSIREATIARSGDFGVARIDTAS